MGREIRMVPPNWSHPITPDNYGRPRRQPMFDRDYDEAKRAWIDGLNKWEATPASERESDCEFWDWDGGPPDREYYRTWKAEDATWFQVWETVSEGTPVTPPFATREELVQYLISYGDEWDQKRGDAAWSEESARAFVGAGWAPSFLVVNSQAIESKDIPAFHAKEKA